MYKQRLLDTLIEKYVENIPAFLVEGAKGVGKTSTCERYCKTIYKLDEEELYEILNNDKSLINKAEKPVLIDEWQLMPTVWNYIRRLVDDGLDEGSVILTGSSPKVNTNIHSGSLRIARITMRPYTSKERELSLQHISFSDLLNQVDIQLNIKTNVTISDYIEEVYKSGFPGVRDKNEFRRDILLKSYIQNIIHHDFEENGLKTVNPTLLLNWMKSYAASIATTTKFQTLIDASMSNNEVMPSKPTAKEYRYALELLHIIYEVPPFIDMGKLFDNLTKAPKHFFLDPSLVVNLLQIEKEQITNYKIPKHIGKFNVSFVGQLFESLVFQSLIVYSEIVGAELYHFRTQNGRREIDFIIKKGIQLLLVEVKTAVKIDNKDVDHLNWFEGIAKTEYNITKLVINTGSTPYRRSDGVYVIPLSLLGN